MPYLTCSTGFELVGSSCYTLCSSGTIVSPVDPSSCVDTVACPSGTTQDIVDISVCNKTPVAPDPISGDCPTNYTLNNTECLVNCPSVFTDNTTTCDKRLFARTTSEPICDSSWFVLQNGTCVPSSSFWALIILIAFVIAILFSIIMSSRTTSCKLKY